MFFKFLFFVLILSSQVIAAKYIPNKGDDIDEPMDNEFPAKSNLIEDIDAAKLNISDFFSIIWKRPYQEFLPIS